MTTTSALTSEEVQLFKKVKKICRAADHKFRKSMLDYILKKGETTVTDLFSHLNIEQAVASQHLKILRDAKFVTTRRDGKFIYYSINVDRISTYVATFNALF